MRLRFPTWVLLRIAERENWTCHICGQGYIPGQRWEISHDVALAKGGTNLLKNLRLAHKGCNRMLGAA